MKKCLLFAVALLSLGAQPLLAENHPSPSKLAKLGLGSMKVAPPEAGLQVRGKGFGASSMLVGLQAMTLVGGNAVAATSQNIVYGHAARVNGQIVFGGTGFGAPAAGVGTFPDFSGYVSVPFVVTAVDASGVSQASASGFLFGFGT